MKRRSGPLARVGTRAGWGLADQALSSITNLALSVVVARRATPEEFGAFGLAFTLYLIAIGFTRAVCAEPLLVRAGTHAADHDSEQGRDGPGEAVGTALVIGLVGTVALGISAVLAPAPLGPVLGALAVTLPGLLVQDTVRHVAFARRRPAAATAYDLVWALAQVLTVAWAVLVADAGASGLTLAWGAAATVAAVGGIVHAGVRPAPTQVRRWLDHERRLVRPFVAEFAARSGARYATLLAVGAIAGLGALGAIRATQVITGPATLVLLGLQAVIIPEAVTLLRRRPAAFGPSITRLAVGLALTAGLLGAAPLLLPDSVGTALLGDSWVLARPVLVPQAVLLASMGATTALVCGLRALAAPDRSLRARLALAPASLAAGVAGALVFADGAVGATAGLAVVNVAGVAVWWRALQAELVSRSGVGATSTPPTPGR